MLWSVCVAGLWGYVWLYRTRVAGRTAMALDGGAAAGTVVIAGGLDVGIEPSDGDVAAAAVPPFSAARAAFGGLITLAAYLMILVAYSLAPLTAVAPLRESAIVLASGWGALRLREATGTTDAVRRIGAAGVVVVGAVLLALEG